MPLAILYITGYTTMTSEERFVVVRKGLERAGYRLVRISGSHHIFEKAGRTLLSIPAHRGKVKPFYVRQIQRIIEEVSSSGKDPQGD